jgi:hypothetical protein
MTLKSKKPLGQLATGHLSVEAELLLNVNSFESPA